MEATNLYYTKNGVPMDEDKTWNYADRFKVKMHTNEQPYELASYYETIQMNFDREPRFYANIGFDGCTWYQYNCPSDSEKDIWTAKNRAGQAQGNWEPTAIQPLDTGPKNWSAPLMKLPKAAIRPKDSLGRKCVLLTYTYFMPKP